LKKSHTLLSYAGYIGATGVGIIRLMKSKHWLKDVVAGAIIGIAATKLAYAIVNKVDSKINLPGVNTEGKPANQNEKTVNIS